MINSLYDPANFVSPVVLQGRLIQREILSSGSILDKYGWDDNLPPIYFGAWSKWLQSLEGLKEIKVDRALYPLGFVPVRQELFTFCDASEKAIGHVSYMRSIDESGRVHVRLISAASKLCPRAATSMPRLELCAAVMGSLATQVILSELTTKPDAVYLFTDSKIVLGYLTNQTRRFSKYVERRVSMITARFPHQQWRYVSTKENPADNATRPLTPEALMESNWFTGPKFLGDPAYSPERESICADHGVELPEERAEVSVLLTRQSSTPSWLSSLFTRIGSWDRLLRATEVILRMRSKLDLLRQKQGVSLAPRCPNSPRPECVKLLVQGAQEECFPGVLQTMKSGKPLPESHPLSKLSPRLDSAGLVRVGGRLKQANIEFSVKHPLLIPANHPLSPAIISHYHLEVKHQGIHLSHGALIQGGFFLETGRTLIRRFISACISCRKLRADTCTQLMADLPFQRLEELPPFTHVGLDVFGHWHIHDGKTTRRTNATKKIWSVIFVCMPSRAIHLEPLYGMDGSSFRNALTRFMSVRGTVQTIRCDNAGNFLATKRHMEELQAKQLSEELARKGITWTLNPPLCSHQNGSIERKIQSVRRVLDTTIQLANLRAMSRDEFTTFLAEAASIVNKTPLWTVPNSPDDPTPISPHMLLTLRPPGDAELEMNITEDDALAYGPRRYRRAQYYSEQFWHRWRKEYLHTLNLRHKWRVVKPCISEGDIVLIREKNVPRNQWPMGRVITTTRSNDGLVRKVTLTICPLPGKTKNRSIVRGITDLVLLIPAQSHGNPHTAC